MKSKKSKNAKHVARWHTTYIKRIRQRFGLNRYKMLCITFGNGLLIGFFLALLLHG